MNHYGKWWNTTITLYNRFENIDGKIKWYSHVIEGCFYSQQRNKVIVDSTVIEANSSLCRIRISGNFMAKDEWNNLPEADKQYMFTLCPGDIIVGSEVEFEIDEYAKGSRSSDMMKKYREWPGCFIVDSVGINAGGGRGNEHYAARGT